MDKMQVTFTNAAGKAYQVKSGFSWTHFCFGPFPFLFRGLWGSFVLCLILEIILDGFAAFPALIIGFTLGFNGFSLDRFCYENFPFLLRGPWGWFFDWLISEIVPICFVLFPTLLSSLILCFVGNKMSAISLFKKGFKPTPNTVWDAALIKWGLAEQTT